jgi:biopolymer transport protein ExbB/TolQ
MSVHNIERLIFNIAHALLVPVLLLVLVALVVTIVEVGRLVAELSHRRRRNLVALDQTVAEIAASIEAGDTARAYELGDRISSSAAMRHTMHALIALKAQSDLPGTADRAAKLLADFDYGSVRRLERTRILVRLGPALGLMGTLIPLSTGLAALARGNVSELSDNLRVAFSVTILGLLVGALAYAVSLVRDRLYGQDFSDLEYVAAGLGLVADNATTQTEVVRSQ